MELRKRLGSFRFDLSWRERALGAAGAFGVRVDPGGVEDARLLPESLEGFADSVREGSDASSGNEEVHP